LCVILAEFQSPEAWFFVDQEVFYFFILWKRSISGGRSVMFRQSDTRLTNLIVVLLDGTGGVGVTKLFIYIVCERRIHAGPVFELQSFIMGPI
jgi:hypothetical protein